MSLNQVSRFTSYCYSIFLKLTVILDKEEQLIDITYYNTCNYLEMMRSIYAYF